MRKDRVRTGVPDPAEAVPFTLEGGDYLQIIVKHPADRRFSLTAETCRNAGFRPVPDRTAI
ncbi:MAG: hypothetical protein LBL31_05725 [Spirochaetaceae bacterium]|nr:hypothetical protein [Spirochaetaceae bacterium]